MATKQPDPGHATSYGRGIAPPGTTMKARPQGESLLRRLAVPVIALVVFCSIFVKPIFAMFHHDDARAIAQSTPAPLGSSQPDAQRSAIDSMLDSQAGEATSSQPALRGSALRNLGVTLPSTAPSAAPSSAQNSAAAAAAAKRVLEDLNAEAGNPGTGNSGGYNAFGFQGDTSGKAAPAQPATPTQPPATPPPTTTPPPVTQPAAIAVENVPTAALPTHTSAPTPAPSATRAANPYSPPAVYVPGPTGMSYVGAEPGQQAGTQPQTAGQMRVAQQAAFLTASGGSMYSDARPEAPHSYNEIFSGRPIHWQVDQDISSLLPGTFYGHITEDVLSSLPIPCDKRICPHELLIPNGTSIKGVYNADTQHGDERMQAHLTALIFPNGWTLPLNDAQGSDDAGANGLPADVNNHVGRIYTVTLIGAIVTGVANTITGHASLLNPQSFGSAAGQGFGLSIADRATQAAQMQLQQAPTLTVKAGQPETFSFSQIQVLPPYRKLAESSRE